MTYEDALGFHLREFDRQVSDLRAILEQPNYDNNESPEVLRLKKDIIKIADRTFVLKQAHANAKSIQEKEATNLGVQ